MIISETGRSRRSPGFPLPGEGARTAVRWTKYAVNNWLRMADPSFDPSLALEFMGLSGPEAKEGLASHTEKRRPSFPTGSAV